MSRDYSSPYVDRIRGRGKSSQKIPKAIFYLLVGTILTHMLMSTTPQSHFSALGFRVRESLEGFGTHRESSGLGGPIVAYRNAKLANRVSNTTKTCRGATLEVNQ